MTINNLIRKVSTLLIILNSFLLGCDHFHEARVIIDPRILKAEVSVAGKTTEEKIILTVKDFASKLNFACDASQRPLYILECGPHGKLSLRKEDDKLVLTLFQMWGNSQYFCNVQGHMFEYFSQKIGDANVKFETNDVCGRKNYP